MSDTPRTDAEARRMTIDCDDSCVEIYVKQDGRCVEGDIVIADFARQLERELNAAKANPIDEVVKRMEAVPIYELDEIWFERTGLEWDFDAAMERIRTRLISAAKGEP